MAEHKAVPKLVYPVSNGEIVVHIQCCDDPLTESRHTFNVMRVPHEQVLAEVTMHCENTAKQHETIQNHIAEIAKALGVIPVKPENLQLSLATTINPMTGK